MIKFVAFATYKLSCYFIKALSTNNSTSIHHFTEKAMAPHSSTLAWKIPWAEEPGRLQSTGLRRLGHD